MNEWNFTFAVVEGLLFCLVGVSVEGASGNDFNYMDSESFCLGNGRVKNNNLKVFNSAMEC